MTRIFTVLCLWLLSAASLYAQRVGDEVFLKGDYVEVGISKCGAYGTTGSAPSQYHPTQSGLGFVSDDQKDGWNRGNPAKCGDYFLPGDPEEGWGIQIGNATYNNNQLCDGNSGVFGIEGEIISYEDLGDEVRAVWRGMVDSLVITQTTIVPEEALYFITQIRIENISTTDKTGVYYHRTLDPDNEFALTNSDKTENEIVYNQPAVNDSRVLVTAKGETYECYLGLGTRDCRGKATISAQSITDRSGAAIHNADPPRLASGVETCNFCPASLAFWIGDVPAGKTRSCSFAYVLSEDELTNALDRTATRVLVDGQDITETLTYTTCQDAPTHIELFNEGNYQWTWTPNIELDTNRGREVIVTPTENRIYTVTGVDCDSIQFQIDLRVRPDTASPVITCPVNPIISADSLACLGITHYPDPIVVDDCNGWTISTLEGPQVGDTINVGDTLITLMVEDISGKRDTCSFTLTVTDDVPPVVNFLADTLIDAPADSCRVKVNYRQPIAQDNCSTASVELISGKGTGSVFSRGTSLEIFEVKDGFGNTRQCTTRIRVRDVAPPTLICPADTVIGTDQPLFYEVTATDNCGQPTLIRTFGQPSGMTYPFDVTNKFLAFDADGNEVRCEFTVFLNDPPKFEDQTFSLPENTTANEFAVVAASDPNGNALTLTLIEESVPGVFGFNPTTRRIRVLDNSKLDHETLPEVVWTMVAQDNGAGNLTDTATIRIRIRDLNEAPTDLLLQPGEVAENQPAGAFVGSFTTIDEDEGSLYRNYALVAGAGDVDNAQFQIRQDTQLVSNAVFDFEAKNLYQIRVRAREALTGDQIEKELTVRILDRNDTPQVLEDTLVTNADIPLPLRRDLWDRLYTDQDGDPMTELTVLSLPASGQLLLSGQPLTAGQTLLPGLLNGLLYEPDLVFSGMVRLEVEASDGTVTSPRATLSILVNPVLEADAGLGHIICQGESTTLGGNPSAIGGTAPYRYQWSPRAGIPQPDQANPLAEPVVSTVYQLTITDAIDATATDTIAITVGKVPEVEAGYDRPLFDGESTQLEAQADRPVSFLWSPANGLSDPAIANPIATPRLLDPASSLLLTYRVEATTELGCRAADSLNIELLPNLSIPTGFSPNGDGVNDTWIIRGIDAFPGNRITVFDRFGQLVYEASNYTNQSAWDGRKNGQTLPTVSYYYVIELPEYGKKFSGHVTIVR